MSIKLTAADCQIPFCLETEKVAEGYFSRTFPSLTAGIQAYRESREMHKALEEQQQAIKAQQEAMMYPALHSTQPDMWMAQQQAMFGGAPSAPSAPTPPVHHRHRRHRHSG